MPAGGTDAWSWSEASVKVGETEYKFASDSTNKAVMATSSAAAEVCKENVSTKKKELGETTVVNDIAVKITTDGCDQCGSDGEAPMIKLCGTSGGCTSACAEVCGPAKAITAATTIAKSAVTEVQVDKGTVENILKVCFYMRKSNTDGWTWKTTEVGTGDDKITFTATQHNNMILSAGNADSAP